MTAFRLTYSNPAPHVEPPSERYEGYDLRDALGDYAPEGRTVAIEVRDEVLGPWAPWMAPDIARELLEVADKLLSLPSEEDDTDWIDGQVSGVPTIAKVYSAVFADVHPGVVLAFATDGADVWLYRGELRLEGVAREGVTYLPFTPGPKPGSREPLRISRQHVLDEIRGFVTRYLDDVIASFPFLRGEPIYEYWRSRLENHETFAAIPGPHPLPHDPERWRKDGAIAAGASSTPPGDPHDDPRVKAAFDDLLESWRAYESLVAAGAKDDEKA